SYDARLLPFGDLREERKPQKARAQLFGEWKIAFRITKSLSHHRGVQRNVVKDSTDPVPLQVRHHAVSRFPVAEQHVEHMVVALTAAGRLWNGEPSALFKRREALAIKLVNIAPASGDHVHRFQLGEQKGAYYLGRNVGGADVHPGVLIYFAAKELAPICALFANDLRALDELRRVYAKRSAFAADVVLCVVKAVSSQVTECTKRPAVVAGVDSLGRVLDYDQPMPFGDLHDAIHVA